jgi:sugar/nucleoside kinase (ribokinase family)
MHITFIGHICLDVIHHPDGSESQGYGGGYYSLVALSNLADNNTTILPVFGIGVKEYEAFIEHLQQFPNIDTSGIYKVNGTTNKVNLFYSDSQNRIECSENISPAIPFKKIKPYLDTNMILLNMVSGFDISLETLDEIRMTVREDKIPIYLDVHSLSLGINEDGKRYRRPLMNWRRWLFMLHAVQLNEEEASGLTVEKYDEENLIKQTTALDTDNVIITRGAKGCTFFHDEHKQIQKNDCAAEPIQTASNSTGCGDVFAAAYCAKYIRTRDFLESAKFANKAAGLKASLGVNSLNELSQYRVSVEKKNNGD